ncbi:MAG: ATP-binding domain-containing protein [Chloroflexota bacterium]|nr:ATP-binding domain-containing protein [Chloroflexota bacterium]
MVAQVRKQLHRLVAEEKVDTEQITVLSTHKTSRSHLARRRRLGNFNLTARPQGPSDIRFTSLHAFKGLESDVVILVDVDGNSQSCSDRHLYVASTRAQELLIVLEVATAA